MNLRFKSSGKGSSHVPSRDFTFCAFCSRSAVVGGKELKLKLTVAFILKYKEQFRSDRIKDLMKFKNAEDMDLETVYNVVWSLAKNADNSIKKPTEFFDEFDNLPFFEGDFLNTIIEMTLGSMGATVKQKKQSSNPRNHNLGRTC